MNVRPISGRPVAVRDALLSHGWEGDLARLSAGGLATAAFHVTGVSLDLIEGMLLLAPRLGLELVTGEDWLILAGGRSRLGAFARPWIQPEAVRELAHAVGVALPAEGPVSWRHSRGEMAVRGAIVVGIVNVTPDSFSDGGTLASVDALLQRVDALRAGGAAVLDIGGESTRPGATSVSPVTEQDRVLPTIRAIRAHHPDIPLSIDTVHATTAAAAIDAGASIINDVTAGRHDPELLAVAAARGAGIVLSHSRGELGEIASYQHADYQGDVAGGVIADLQASVRAAEASGIAPEQMVLDPGFGFGKRSAQSFSLLDQLDAVVALNHPVMVGLSRKRFLGEAAGRDVHDRERATAAACALAYDRGARFFRVHDPAAVRDALAIASALTETQADG